MRRIKTLIAVAAMSITASVFAQAAGNTNATDPEMLLKLKQLYPNTTFRQVTKTDFNGLYEVVMGQNVAYVESSGRYWLFGHLFDMQTQQDLTAAKVEETNRIDMASLDLKDAIKQVKGNGKRTLIVFSDPDCPYCRQLEATLEGLSDVTIYTFLYPIDGLHPNAREKSANVWCSSNRQEAWRGLMRKGGEIKSTASCATPLDRIAQFAEKNKITGTPTMLSMDGRKLPGAAPLAQINRFLDTPEAVAKADVAGQRKE